jgi:hypothetical protein
MRTLLLMFLLMPCLVLAQNSPGTSLHIRKAKGNIVLDAKLDEADWQTADVARNWFLNYPVDTVFAPFQTEARVTFDDQFFYVSFLCYDDNTPDLINSLRRDFEYPYNDNVGVNVGPFNDGLNGFFFAVTPAGVQREGTISGGGSGTDAFNSFWDNKWYSKVVRYPDRWIGEAAVPWKSFRYKSDLTEWNILFDRSDKKRNMRSGWIRTPIQFPTGMFAFSGKLIWDDPIPPARTNISVIPYVAGITSREGLGEERKRSSELQAGFDAKVGITPSMNLDLTVNPDFSQVEVDQQVINLTRFEFQFPELRQFFLENSDLFSRAGNGDLRVLYCLNHGCPGGANGTLDFAVASTGDVGWSSAMVVPPNELPVIVYYDATNQQYRVVRCLSVSCNLTGAAVTVGSSGWANTLGGENAIDVVLDAAGLPFAATTTLTTTDVNIRSLKCESADCR